MRWMRACGEGRGGPHQQGHDAPHQCHEQQGAHHRRDIMGYGVFLVDVHKTGPLPLHTLHFRQPPAGLQIGQLLAAVGQGLAQGADGGQVGLLPLQLDDVPPQAVLQGQNALLHFADLLQRHVQLSQQLDLPQDLRVGVGVVPVAVVRVPSGVQQSLFFVESDVALGDAHQLLHLVDLHAAHLRCKKDIPSTRWKVKRKICCCT